jgi:phosphoribosylamine-glycine ligase
MENIGILVVSYGSRAASMVDAFSRSNYNVKLYIADKQKNPFNLEKATEHVVIPDLSVEKICEWAKSRAEKINFGVVCPEGPIIAGIRDVL